MESEIKKIKKKINAVSPLLIKNQIILDELTVSMKEKAEDLDKSISEYDKTLNKKEMLIREMQKKGNFNEQLNLNDLFNSRNYLGQLDEGIERLNVSVQQKKTALSEAREKIFQQQLSIKCIEKYKGKNLTRLNSQQEKNNMKQLDELVAQKYRMSVKHG